MPLDARRSVGRVELRYRKEPALRAELERLTAAENQCCNVDGVVFEFVENEHQYIMYVIAPDQSCVSIAVAIVLENFAGMAQRPMVYARNHPRTS
jgi:hypothetical protein